MMKVSRSNKLFSIAKDYLPGGVNSPVRAFKSVGGIPRFIAKGFGAYLEDVDHNHYIDYVGSWGPMILGHAHPKIIQAVKDVLEKGTSFGAPSPLEVEMAKQLCQRLPSMEKVRMVNSGTEAVMGALRLARGFTGKNKILKFQGCYHGHADYLLVEAGSGALTHGTPNSLGVPEEFAKHTLVAPYNDLEAVKKLVQKNKNDLAAIIVEPVAGNMGLMLPKAGFLKGLQKICRETGALLVFDEVMTGFRVHSGGAQALYQIKPDLTTLGKIIGGGFPVGAYGGKKKIMDYLSPEGGVYQAGTLSGNPVAMAAGLATLKLLNSPKVYARLEKQTQRLTHGLSELAKKADLPLQVPSVCGMFSIFFSSKPVHQLNEVPAEHIPLFKEFFKRMLDRGIYLPPSPFEACFVSLSHGENEIAKTLRAAKDSMYGLMKEQ